MHFNVAVLKNLSILPQLTAPLLQCHMILKYNSEKAKTKAKLSTF